ncbi:MAG TPA: FAD:protein FMN transferase [Nocardioides sp.]|nr:FAD:protein FMN transferase [Nocardioides sp.]
MGTTHARFDALGTYAFLAVRRPGGLADAVRLAKRVLSEIDATCSRFRDDSDLTRANRNAGKWVEVDPLLIAAVEAACDAAKQSGGLVHPLLGRPMVQLGYDRDFDQLSERADTLQFPWVDPGPSLDSWQEIGLDHTGAIKVPDGTALDLGSVGKAWASDMIAAGIEQELGLPAIVSLGGDIRIACPDWDPWHVAISERPGTSPDALVGLVCGGLATSSTQVRRWKRGGAVRHHLLDPRTGAPAPEVWRTVTAIGSSCTAANTASTASIVLGHEATGWLGDLGVTARLVDAHGNVTRTGNWPAEDIERNAA